VSVISILVNRITFCLRKTKVSRWIGILMQTLSWFLDFDFVNALNHEDDGNSRSRSVKYKGRNPTAFALDVDSILDERRRRDFCVTSAEEIYQLVGKYSPWCKCLGSSFSGSVSVMRVRVD